jgi:hypothetical protein
MKERELSNAFERGEEENEAWQGYKSKESSGLQGPQTYWSVCCSTDYLVWDGCGN